MWLITAGLVLLALPSSAAVLCSTRRGLVKLREAACKPREQPVDPIALGLQGPPGEAGTPGSAGPPGVSAYEIETLSTPTGSIDPGEVFDAPDALCPAGKRALGGGCFGSNSVAVLETAPRSAGDGWQCKYRNVSAGTVSSFPLTYVICATVQ
jgi:hypothetical protein